MWTCDARLVPVALTAALHAGCFNPSGELDPDAEGGTSGSTGSPIAMSDSATSSAPGVTTAGASTTSTSSPTSDADGNSDAESDTAGVDGSSETSDGVDPSTTSTSTGSEPPGESTGDVEDTSDEGSESTGLERVDCEGLLNNITGQGSVSASTVFAGFPANLSVDGDLSTSWFSTGPEGDGTTPSVYTWTLGQARCINSIVVADNASHANAGFQQGFGFNLATVRVLHGTDVMYQELVPLPGDPDGQFIVDTGGVPATQVLLELSGHEDPSCGGFSELTVLGGNIP